MNGQDAAVGGIFFPMREAMGLDNRELTPMLVQRIVHAASETRSSKPGGEPPVAAGPNEEDRKARWKGHFQPFPDSLLKAEGTGMQISAKGQPSRTAFLLGKLDTSVIRLVPASV